ncbi:MAG: NADPH:quinone oxidoreductase family protein [Rhodospirillum sp.]|nr:NADPH:quinone oxidoreductase family protein [Rhodospirillum sp.]MCF8487943.1 NADPH:quinone oxidoreductase family protein [Rhodospirillum sp.]MCF8499290.1 NADPH:quinone oxidoreductase family protein [Rhodospirillum sp.]
MRAQVCTAFGSHEDLTFTDVPEPEMSPDGVRIRVAAAALNFADTLFIAGTYQVKAAPPFIPGFEVAGEVLEVGPDVTGLTPGDRVMAILDRGGFAEQVVAPARDVYPLTSTMRLLEAAGFPIAYGTSHFGLTDRCHVAPGETVLVHGAAGGVGLTAVECAKVLGARVIATAGGPDKLAVATAHGADEVIDYRTENIKARVRELTGGRGADVVYDPVGGEIFEASVRCTAPDGRILVVGFASGTIPAPAANILLVKNISVIGFNWGGYRSVAPDRVRASLAELLSWWNEGKLKPHVGATYPLADAVKALRALKARAHTGKVILIP